jgi:hypothetical protein
MFEICICDTVSDWDTATQKLVFLLTTSNKCGLLKESLKFVTMTPIHLFSDGLFSNVWIVTVQSSTTISWKICNHVD